MGGTDPGRWWGRVQPFGPRDELGDEPALAHPGVPVDRHEVRLPSSAERWYRLLRSSSSRSRPTIGACSPGTPRSSAPGVRSSSTTAGIGCSFPRSSWSPSSRSESRAPRGRCVRPPRSPWVRALFEPRGHVDRIARHHRLSRSRVGGREDLAGVHAGSDLERHAEAALEIRVDLDEPFAHPQGSPEGSRRVVLMCGRHAERRHHGIADELLDRPALRLDLLPHRSEVRPEHLLESLRVQAFAEARRARHIREQDRHHAPVLTGGAGSSSSSADPHAGQNRAPRGTSAPQVGHDGTSDAPQEEQKRAPSRFSAPHAAQVFTAASLRPPPDAEPDGCIRSTIGHRLDSRA